MRTILYPDGRTTIRHPTSGSLSKSTTEVGTDLFDDELTELLAMEPDELHLVGRGANGFPQLLAKSFAEEIDGQLAAERRAAVAALQGS